MHENIKYGWTYKNAEFKKSGKTKMVIESSEGKKTVFDITIRRDTYDIKENNDWYNHQILRNEMKEWKTKYQRLEEY